MPSKLEKRPSPHACASGSAWCALAMRAFAAASASGGRYHCVVQASCRGRCGRRGHAGAAAVPLADELYDEHLRPQGRPDRRDGPAGRRGGVADDRRTGIRSHAGEHEGEGRREQACRHKRMKGLEPSTFCMASRRSSQLSYIRATADYSPAVECKNPHRALRDRRKITYCHPQLNGGVRQWISWLAPMCGRRRAEILLVVDGRGTRPWGQRAVRGVQHMLHLSGATRRAKRLREMSSRDRGTGS